MFDFEREICGWRSRTVQLITSAELSRTDPWSDHSSFCQKEKRHKQTLYEKVIRSAEQCKRYNFIIEGIYVSLVAEGQIEKGEMHYMVPTGRNPTASAYTIRTVAS